MDEQNESNALVAWILGIAVTIAIVVSLVTGIVGALGAGSATAIATPAANASVPVPSATSTAPAAEAAQAPAAATGADVPEPAKLHFASGSADLPDDAGQQLRPLIAYLGAQAGAKLAVSGFHDTSGNAAANAELAKQRALATRAALLQAGVADDRIVLVKPREAAGGTDAAEARRVEVYATP